MFRYTCVFVVVTVVAIMFSNRYQTQREEKKETERLARLEEEIRVKTAEELDDYCDTICKLHSCHFGQQDVHQADACLCFDYQQKRCDIA